MDKPATIYIVENHPLVQRLLQEVIGRQPQLRVCGMVSTAEEALQQLPYVAADLVLVDLSLSGMSGIELIQILRVQYPTLPCLVLSSHQDFFHVQQALIAGAGGYLTKDNPYELVPAIHQVLMGKTYLSQSVRDSAQRAGHIFEPFLNSE